MSNVRRWRKFKITIGLLVAMIILLTLMAYNKWYIYAFISTAKNA